MKLTRTELKSIVKECLVEILAEGMGNFLSESRSSTKGQVVESVKVQKRFDPLLDTPIVKKAVASPKINTGNSVFDDILADTAKTTLPNMLQAEGTKQPQATGTIERLVESSTPEELFGDDASSKWASLAFSASPRKS